MCFTVQYIKNSVGEDHKIIYYHSASFVTAVCLNHNTDKPHHNVAHSVQQFKKTLDGSQQIYKKNRQINNYQNRRNVFQQ